MRDNVGPDNATGAIAGTVAYVWQVDHARHGVFEDIVIATGPRRRARHRPHLHGASPTWPASALRVKAVYQDANGVHRDGVLRADRPGRATSTIAPTGAPTISDTTPTEGGR